MKKWFQGEMGGCYACAHACFYACAQYLISDSLLIVYNLSEVSQSVVGDRVKTKIRFSVFFPQHSCYDKERSFSLKAGRQSLDFLK